MEQRERVTMLEGILKLQLGWIVAADSRATFAFALNTAMLGLLAAVAPKSVAAWTFAPGILVFIYLIFSGASVGFLTAANFPRTTGPKNSLIFSAGIAQRDLEQYLLAMQERTTEQYIKDLSEQCHRNAQIATAKFTWIQQALIALYLSVLFWVPSIWLLYNSSNR